jgi:hypothetical protein
MCGLCPDSKQVDKQALEAGINKIFDDDRIYVAPTPVVLHV